MKRKIQFITLINLGLAIDVPELFHKREKIKHSMINMEIHNYLSLYSTNLMIYEIYIHFSVLLSSNKVRSLSLNWYL